MPGCILMSAAQDPPNATQDLVVQFVVGVRGNGRAHHIDGDGALQWQAMRELGGEAHAPHALGTPRGAGLEADALQDVLGGHQAEVHGLQLHPHHLPPGGLHEGPHLRLVVRHDPVRHRHPLLVPHEAQLVAVARVQEPRLEGAPGEGGDGRVGDDALQQHLRGKRGGGGGCIRGERRGGSEGERGFGWEPPSSRESPYGPRPKAGPKILASILSAPKAPKQNVGCQPQTLEGGGGGGGEGGLGGGGYTPLLLRCTAILHHCGGGVYMEQGVGGGLWGGGGTGRCAEYNRAAIGQVWEPPLSLQPRLPHGLPCVFSSQRSITGGGGEVRGWVVLDLRWGGRMGRHTGPRGHPTESGAWGMHATAPP